MRRRGNSVSEFTERNGRNQNKMETKIIFDIETVPVNPEAYEEMTEVQRKKTINAIDQRIVAIGTSTKDGMWTIVGDDEKDMLNEFWNKLPPFFTLCGFNIKQFDLPMLITRSFANNIPITPFNVHDTIDLREYLNCHAWGYTRGKLKEYGEMCGIKYNGEDGSMVYNLWKEKRLASIEEYLRRDLQITTKVYERCMTLGIMSVKR